MLDTKGNLFVHYNDKWLPVTGLCVSDEEIKSFYDPNNPDQLLPVTYIDGMALMVNMNKAQAYFSDGQFRIGAQAGPKMYVRPPYFAQHKWFAVRGSFTSAAAANDFMLNNNGDTQQTRYGLIHSFVKGDLELHLIADKEDKGCTAPHDLSQSF